MPEFKKNHIISKCLLKQWNTQGPNYVGVHLYNITKKKYQFSNGTGNSAFTFAMENNFYIHEANGKRYTEIEEMFGNWENILAKVIGRIMKKSKVAILEDRKTFDLFFKAILSLKFRTKGFLNNLKLHLLNNSEEKNLIEKNEAKDINLVSLEAIINCIEEEYLSFSNCEMYILYDKKGELITGDEPFIGCDYIIDGKGAVPFEEYNSIALSPYHLIRYRKSQSKTTFRFGNISQGLIESYNNIIAEQSYYWIVGRNESILRRYVDIANEVKIPQEFTVRKAKFIKEYFRIQQ